MDIENTTSLKMSSEAKITIDPEKIDYLIQDINKYTMKLNDLFNKINNIIAGTKDSYKSESGSNIRRQFEEFYPNLSSIIQSMENYAYSLKNVKDNFLSLTQTTGNNLKNATNNVASIPKKVE